MDIILASSNPNKLKEVKEILKDLNINVISISELGYDKEIEENGSSFKENALIKAKTIYDIYHKPVLSDDSGLEVEALNGAPGIYSARYSGLGPEGNKKLLLKNLENKANRNANFTCTLCFYESDSKINYFVGKVYGVIDYKETGNNGFGYDPLFLYNGVSFASITKEEKNKVSHRAKAFELFIRYIKEETRK